MAEQVRFAAQKRTALGKAASKLRRQGIIPANIVVQGRESIAVQVNGLELGRFLAKHSATTLLRLTLGGSAGDESVIIQHVQREPVTGAIQHVDFLHIDMAETMRVRLPLHLVGEAPAVKRHGGMLLPLLDHIEVEARPGDLPEALTLDVSGLEELKSSLRVRDIPLPAGIIMLTDEDETVVKIDTPRGTIEEAPAATAEAATPAATGGTAENAPAQS
jgi:large subunit ribosomal protein L25